MMYVTSSVVWHNTQRLAWKHGSYTQLQCLHLTLGTGYFCGSIPCGPALRGNLVLEAHCDLVPEALFDLISKALDDFFLEVVDDLVTKVLATVAEVLGDFHGGIF